MKVYASFVTFHPDAERFNLAVKSVEPQVDKVIVVDNTRKNEGIAAALNRAFRQAESEGCEYLITFDQDSVAPSGLVAKLLKDIEGLDKAGQIGPAYTGFKSTGAGVIEQDYIITSGSLTSVEAWHTVGGFRDDYFIDGVDFEFSLHLRKAGYRVLLDTEIVLDHQLGDSFVGWDISGKKRLGYIDHAALRWYYMFRNCLVTRRTYRNDFPSEVSSLWHAEIRRIIRMLINGRDRRPRVKMILKGWRDYRKGIMGEYSDE